MSGRLAGGVHLLWSGGGIDNMEAQQSHIGDEWNTVIHIRERHTSQLQEAVSHYLPTLYRRAYRYVGDPHDAEDAVQDALLSAYKHLNQFKGTARMTTWLTTIVTNSALTQLRRRSGHSHVSLNEQLNEEQDYSLSDTLADARPNPEDECASWESHGFLMQFLSELSPSLQQAIQLRYLDGLTTSEAARVLEVPLATMKSRLWRARAQLKWMMSGL
jgi:RNA polymerase sigma-70 factor (ECF subfamily)